MFKRRANNCWENYEFSFDVKVVICLWCFHYGFFPLEGVSAVFYVIYWCHWIAESVQDVCDKEIE